MQHKYVVNYAWLLTHFASSFVVQKVMRYYLCQNVDYHLLEVYRYYAFAHVGRLLRGRRSILRYLFAPQRPYIVQMRVKFGMCGCRVSDGTLKTKKN